MADLGAIGGSGTVGTTGGGAASGGTSSITAATSLHLVGEIESMDVVESLIPVTPVFTWRPNSCSQATKHRTQSAVFGDGFEQRVSDGLNTTMLEFMLTFDQIPEDEGDAIQAFLDARKGVEYFLWTPPRGTQTKYVCTEPIKREWNPDVDGVSDITITLRQVFDL